MSKSIIETNLRICAACVRSFFHNEIGQLQGETLEAQKAELERAKKALLWTLKTCIAIDRSRRDRKFQRVRL